MTEAPPPPRPPISLPVSTPQMHSVYYFTLVLEDSSGERMEEKKKQTEKAHSPHSAYSSRVTHELLSHAVSANLLLFLHSY